MGPRMGKWVSSLALAVLSVAAGVVGPIANWPAAVWATMTVAFAVFALGSAPFFQRSPRKPQEESRPSVFVKGNANGSRFSDNTVHSDTFVGGDANDAIFEGNSFNESLIQRWWRRLRRAV